MPLGGWSLNVSWPSPRRRSLNWHPINESRPLNECRCTRLRSAGMSPPRHRRIVLFEPNKDALGQADVEAPLGIAQHINLILIRCIHGRAENGCGGWI